MESSQVSTVNQISPIQLAQYQNDLPFPATTDNYRGCGTAATPVFPKDPMAPEDSPHKLKPCSMTRHEDENEGSDENDETRLPESSFTRDDALIYSMADASPQPTWTATKLSMC